MFADKSLWGSENVGYLVRYFAENLNEGEGNFIEKLEAQLGPAPPIAKQLAAEMLWVMYLILVPSAMQPGTKRQQIQRVWEWSGEDLPDAHVELNEALKEGVAHPGPGFHIHRWREFLFFIGAMQAWKGLSAPERDARLADPWVFAKWISDQDESGTRQLRHILLYLLFPGHFDPVTTNFQKRDIVRAFRTKFGEDPNLVDYDDITAVDRQMLMVRERLEGEGAIERFSFFDPALAGEWRPGGEPQSDEPGPEPVEDRDTWYAGRYGKGRVWVLSPGQNARYWDDFREMNVIAIGWDGLGDLRELTRESIQEKLVDLLGQPKPTNSSLACYQFAHDMQPGDRVIVKRGMSVLLGHGVVKSRYEFHAARPEFKHVRQVEWKATGEWALPKERRVTPKTLTDFGDPIYHDWLRFAYGLMKTGQPPEPKPEPEAPYPLEEALQDLFMEPAKFHDIMDALERKKNIVLEGPPGVGKTFIAKRLAFRLIGYKVPERVRMVQFHQSYAYEDFIQGYRPSDDGHFKRQNGVFHTFCCDAAKNPKDRYVFIIDEVNRGNLSKIFGELMMLIEADKRGLKHAIPLTYSPERDPFYVPENLFLIAMMNTADRSLAMVDYALRRRFAFIRLNPAFQTDHFSDFLNAAGVEEAVVKRIVDRLPALNKEIRKDRKNLGPGFEIGHSFFCPRDEDEQLDESWYEGIVRREIKPLLREYWFDRPERVQEQIRVLLA